MEQESGLAARTSDCTVFLAWRMEPQSEPYPVSELAIVIRMYPAFLPAVSRLVPANRVGQRCDH